MLPSSPFQRLHPVWGRSFTSFESWPIPPEGLPQAREEILAILRVAPEGALEFVGGNASPDVRMQPLPLPADRAEFLDPPPGRLAALRAGNLSGWNEAAAEWCKRWARELELELAGTSEPFVDVRAEMYISAPGTVVAFHADPSHNFCLQVLGKRVLHVHDNDDPRLIDEVSRPGVFFHRAQYPIYRDDCGDREVSFALEAGRAAYIPPLAGHWLQNGDELSVSYVVSVRTRAEQREKLVHGMNARLRSMGYKPSAFGMHPRRERIKAGVEFGLRRSRSWIARHIQRRWSEAYEVPLDL